MADQPSGDLIPVTPIHDGRDAAAAQKAVVAFHDELAEKPGKVSKIGFQKLSSQITETPDTITKLITISNTTSVVDSKTFTEPETPAQFTQRGFENELVLRTDVRLSNNAITSERTTDSTGPGKHTHEDASFLYADDGRKGEHFVSTEDQGTQHGTSTGDVFIKANGTELYSASGQTNAGMVLSDYGQHNPDGTGFFNRTSKTVYAGAPVVYVREENCTRANGDLSCTVSETLTSNGQPISKTSPLDADDFDLHFPSIDAPPPVLSLNGERKVGATHKHRKGDG